VERARSSVDSAERRVNFRKYDLNLLPFLRSLLMNHSVARTSEALGVSQSAVSGALQRLNETFGAPLFVRVGRNLVPTQKAAEIKPDVDGLFILLSSLYEKRNFYPETEARCFTVCTSDYVITELSAPLLKILSLRAPNITLKFVELSNSEMKEVESGNIDLQISPRRDGDVSDKLCSKVLWNDEHVILGPKYLVDGSSNLNIDNYLKMKHASFFVSGAESIESRALKSLGIKQNTVIFVPEHNQLPRLVQTNDCLAMVPKSIAARYASQFNLKIYPVPFEIPAFDHSLYWSSLLDQDPAHRWFRDLIFEAWESRSSGVVG
jgi:DNA-binding transcriptional LysR family regulator